MNIEDVNPLHEDGTPKSPEEIAAEASGGDTTVAPGSKTDSTLLLKSLQDEREKRRLLEEELALLKQTTTSTEDIFSDEGKALQKKIDDQNVTINTLSENLAKKDVLIAYPVLSEKWEDFEKFRSDPENQGMSMTTSAKAYLVENGLLDQKRKGLEKPTGGDRQPPSTKMSAEDVKILRETNFKKYQELLQKGLIEI